jgi:tetratricopeptide (TPR) repeat protein
MAERETPVRRAKNDRHDRAALLARAARAARRGSRRARRKAIALVREVLTREPDNADLQRKLAALLARDGELRQAWTTYKRAIDDRVRRGFADQAIGVCREAASGIPREPAVWRELASLQLARGRAPDAVEALLEGSAQLRSRALRPQALELLLEARRIDARHLEANLALARALARSGSRRRAAAIVDELIAFHPGQARRLCAARLQLAPGLRSACGWLAALCAPAAGSAARAHSGRGRPIR